jgi:hypothetical protein
MSELPPQQVVFWPVVGVTALAVLTFVPSA